MNNLHTRIERLEQQSGDAPAYAALLALLEPEDRIFLQSTLSAEARHKGGFEAYIRTLAREDLMRLERIYSPCDQNDPAQP